MVLNFQRKGKPVLANVQYNRVGEKTASFFSYPICAE